MSSRPLQCKPDLFTFSGVPNLTQLPLIMTQNFIFKPISNIVAWLNFVRPNIVKQILKLQIFLKSNQAPKLKTTVAN